MDQSTNVDFPEFPEAQCPSTPGPQLNIKTPDLAASSSSEEAEAARGEGSKSPPPNCAICLGKCKNKCFTDSCMHQFCFKCLLEWSKVKPECPLCKQTFKSIIHNVKSMDQFEEYVVQQPIASPLLDAFGPFTIPAHLYPRMPMLYNPNGPVNLYMDDLQMNTLDLTGTSSSTSTMNAYVQRGGASFERRVMPGAAQLLDMYSQEYVHGETGSGSLSQLWRRYVYDRKLFAMPVSDITGRLRESSSRFYRDNPSQIHRLMPWINRDIVCLLRNTEHDVSAVLEQINGMLMTCNILSPEFRRRLQPFLSTNTVHFVHELNNFARSPYDMVGYDRVVQYSPANTEEVIIEFSTTTSGGSDVESVNDVQEEASSSRLASQLPNVRNVNSGFNVYTTTTTSTSLQALAINLSTHNRGVTGEGITATVQIFNTPLSEQPTNIVLSSTSSSECEFVMEQKPPHLRTPEMVSLNSDSDSDVVFVQETKTPLPPAVTKWSTTNNARCRRPQRRRADPLANSNSYSSSESDTRLNHISTAKKFKYDIKSGIIDEVATDASAASNPTNDQLPKVKEEFNQGASTSTGLQSRYRNTRPNIARARHYRHYTDTSDSAEIEDTDSSSSASYLTTEGSNSTSDSDTSWSKSRRNSNKQSLKRSRQRKASAANSNRKTRQNSSKKFKRSKRTKSTEVVTNKSSSSTKKKKASKRSRRKSPKSKTIHKKRRSAPQKIDPTSEEEQTQPETQVEEDLQNILASSWSSSISSVPTAPPQSDAEPPPTTPQQQSSSTTFSPISFISTSDANDVAEFVSSSTIITAVAGSLPPSHSILSVQLDFGDNQHASLTIYSDTD